MTHHWVSSNEGIIKQQIEKPFQHVAGIDRENCCGAAFRDVLK